MYFRIALMKIFLYKSNSHSEFAQKVYDLSFGQRKSNFLYCCSSIKSYPKLCIYVTPGRGNAIFLC